IAEHFKTELDRVLAGRDGELVDEGLHDERNGVAARRPECPGWHPERHNRRVEGEVWHEALRELGRSDVGARSKPLALAEGDEVVPPRDELARRVYDKKRFDEAINKIMGSELKPDEIINGAGQNGLAELRWR